VPLLSVIVVNWNTRELLHRCLTSVEKYLPKGDYETIVVDNASTDGSSEMVQREFPMTRLIKNTDNLGFGRGNNLGMASASGDFFLLLNSDARLIDDTPLRLVKRLKHRSRVGVIGPIVRYEDGRLQATAHRFEAPWRLLVEELWLYRAMSRSRVGNLLLGVHWDHAEEREVDWVTGVCMVVRREVFEETGGFDPSIFMYGEEVEWARRIRQSGWSILFSPLGEVIHIGHASADLLLGDDGRIDRCLLSSDRLIRAWYGQIAGTLAPGIRVAGALLRLFVFSLGPIRKRNEAYARDVRQGSKLVLGHYLRRARGQTHDARGLPSVRTTSAKSQ
jgi:GT2 family glycosyltransferase